MSQFKSVLQWLAIATVFDLSLYFGLVEGIQGAANIAQFYIWFVSLVSLVCLSDKFVRERQKKGDFIMSAWLATPQNLAVLALLLWYGWTWSAGAYLVKIILVSRVRTPLPSPDPSPATP